jgi:hypothetical protein
VIGKAVGHAHMLRRVHPATIKDREWLACERKKLLHAWALEESAMRVQQCISRTGITAHQTCSAVQP